MSKKIIAVFCAVILMASIFVACGKKDRGYLLAEDEDGNIHAYVTDIEGNTVLNKDGKICVYVTEKNGEIATNKDGQKAENVIDFPERILSDSRYETKGFYLNIEEGWSNAKNGQYLKNNDEKCFIEITEMFSEYDAKTQTLTEVMESTVDSNKQVIEKLGEEYPVSKIDHGLTKIKDIEMYKLEYYIEDSNKNVYQYGESYYFAQGNKIYCIMYANVDGSGYDSNFDFAKYLENNLIIK